MHLMHPILSASATRATSVNACLPTSANASLLPLTSSHAATRSMRPMVSSSSVSWGAVTQWMQLTGHVSIASCSNSVARDAHGGT